MSRIPLRASGIAALAALVALLAGPPAAVRAQGASIASGASSAPSGLASVLAGLADRVQQYYDRVGSIICVESVTQQDLRSNLTPTGKPRRTVFELMVMRDPKGKGEAQFRVERTLQMVNGKPARKNQTPECTDPKSGTPEPLGFLLAGNQSHYKFSLPSAAASRTPAGPEGTVALDFVQVPPDRVVITWEGNCFTAEGGGQQGRLWFDPETFDVLQVVARLPRPFLVPVRGGTFVGPTVSIWVLNSTMTLRFARVKFDAPDETVLLPESTEVVTEFRGVPSMRSHQTLSNFRRFLSETVIRPVLQ